jgi:hypothetical protein
MHRCNQEGLCFCCLSNFELKVQNRDEMLGALKSKDLDQHP